MTTHVAARRLPVARSGTTDDFAGRILAMFAGGKPRTSEDVARRLDIPVNAAGRFLCKLHRLGTIKKTGKLNARHVWEMVK